MRAGFNIKTEQGPLTVHVTLAEFMRWGQREQKPVASIAENSDIETWIELIWWAATRSGQTSSSLEDFAASIIDLERLEAGNPKATPRARGNTPSSRSKS